MKITAFSRRSTVVILLALLVGGIVTIWAVHQHQEKRHQFHAVAEGVLYRARQPRPEDLRKNLQALNIRTVVNLRGEFEDPTLFEEEKQICESLGAKMVSIVATSPTPTGDELAQFLKIVRRNDGATLVHCELGKARTGCMVGAYRVIVEGVEADKAAEEAAAKGRFSPDELRVVRDWLRKLQSNRQEWLARTAPENPPTTTVGG